MQGLYDKLSGSNNFVRTMMMMMMMMMMIMMMIMMMMMMMMMMVTQPPTPYSPLKTGRPMQGIDLCRGPLREFISGEGIWYEGAVNITKINYDQYIDICNCFQKNCFGCCLLLPCSYFCRISREFYSSAAVVAGNYQREDHQSYQNQLSSKNRYMYHFSKILFWLLSVAA